MGTFLQTIFCKRNWDSGVTITPGGGEVALGFSADSLLYAQPREYVRTKDSTLTFNLTFDISEDRDVDTVALLFANIHNSSATWRLKLYEAADHVTPVLDTGNMTFWASPNLEGYDRTHALWFSPSTVYSVDRIEIVVTDSLSDDNYISIGNAVISSAWRPSLNISYSSSPFGFASTSEFTPASSGAVHYNSTGVFSDIPMLMESNSKDEVYQSWYSMFSSLGNSTPVLIVQMPEDASYIFQSMVWGVINGPVTPVIQSYEFYRLRLSVRGLN